MNCDDIIWHLIIHVTDMTTSQLWTSSPTKIHQDNQQTQTLPKLDLPQSVDIQGYMCIHLLHTVEVVTKCYQGSAKA